MTHAKREHLLTVRFSDEEQARAERVAEHYGLNVSSLVRMLLREQARTLGIDAPTRTKRSA